jgi:hypothetical protein
MGDSASKTGVLLVLHFVVPSIVLLGAPVVTVDGLLPVRMDWGKEFVALSAGKHTTACYAQIFRGLRSREGLIEFDLPENNVIELRWRAPLLANGRGRWKNLGLVDLP